MLTILLSVALASTGCINWRLPELTSEGDGDADSDADWDIETGDAEVDGDADIDSDADADDITSDAEADGDEDLVEDADHEEGPWCGNAVREPDEECDDGDDDEDDGCTSDCFYSCHGHFECDEGNDCTADECVTVEDGRACQREILVGDECNDDMQCTLTDTCNELGVCVGVGNPCEDGLDCSVNTCNEEGRACAITLEPDSCLIGDGCYTSGDFDPTDMCRLCHPDDNRWGWTGRPDFTSCTPEPASGRTLSFCADGSCVSPGCGTASCNQPGPGFPLADTSQLLCYGENALTSCPGVAGTDACARFPFCGQDAQYGWDFTTDDRSRFA